MEAVWCPSPSMSPGLKLAGVPRPPGALGGSWLVSLTLHRPSLTLPAPPELPVCLASKLLTALTLPTSVGGKAVM